jgi:polar amino acid transport system substrate-binding protein
MPSISQGLLRSACLAAALCLSLPCANAQEPATLHAVTGNDTAPFNFLDDKGELRGMGLDMANELARRANLKLDVRALPWGRALQMAREQKDLLLFTVARTPERETWFHWIGPLAEREVWLWKLAARQGIQPTNLQQVRQYRVADTPNNATVAPLQHLGVDIQFVTSHAAIAEMLKLGRVDLAPVSLYNIEAFAAGGGMEVGQLARTLLLARSSGYYLALRHDSDPALVTRLQAAFATMLKDKTAARIAGAWAPRTATGGDTTRK